MIDVIHQDNIKCEVQSQEPLSCIMTHGTHVVENSTLWHEAEVRSTTRKVAERELDLFDKSCSSDLKGNDLIKDNLQKNGVSLSLQECSQNPTSHLYTSIDEITGSELANTSSLLRTAKGKKPWLPLWKQQRKMQAVYRHKKGLRNEQRLFMKSLRQKQLKKKKKDGRGSQMKTESRQKKFTAQDIPLFHINLRKQPIHKEKQTTSSNLRQNLNIFVKCLKSFFKSLSKSSNLPQNP